MGYGETPVKPGWQTTEFWVNIFIQIVGICAMLGYFTPEQQSALTEAFTQLGSIVAMVASAFGYSLSRGMAKKK